MTTELRRGDSLALHVMPSARTAVDRDRLVETRPMRDAFQSEHSNPSGERFPAGGNPFVDDGNSFYSVAGVPAIAHGATAGGTRTTAEWPDIDDLVRVARFYALYCPTTPRWRHIP